jgi:mono/diheme cytochrome c family protein
MKTFPRELLFLSAVCVLAPWTVRCVGAQAPAAATGAAGKSEFFEKYIRPVLVAECVDCHGPEKQKGGLRLDSQAGWQKGGDSGEAIVPGSPEKSLLLRTIQHLEPELKMPDKAPKLDDAVAQHFAQWIAMGAPDPREQAAPDGQGVTAKPAWADLLAARRTWWSLQPLSNAQPPEARASHPVDRFLEQAFSKAGVEVSGAASPAVLARRLHFLLTGLPPSVEEVRSFEAGAAVDRARVLRERTRSLLASPAFGEHWARRWMDLMRYAESHGSEGDPEIPGAFQYRDYLIRAFNADIPLDVLIREHLAGDLLAQPRISMEGFEESKIGPAQFRLVEHGYQPVDSQDDRVKAVDNQIDVVTKAFQGLTVSCARCHDHKFDAISQRDYTALYGVLDSLRPTQVAVGAADKITAEQKQALARIKPELRSELAGIWAAQLGALPAALAHAAQPPVLPEVAKLAAELERVRSELSEKEWARFNLGKARGFPAPYAVWSFNQGANDLLGRVKAELQGGAVLQDGALVLDGKGSFLRTEALPDGMVARTLEAWVSPANLEQRGGGVVAVEMAKGHAFDALVFGEKEAGKWMAGSEFFKRSQQTNGPAEDTAPGALVHVAVSYAPDGTVSVYRNGKRYGEPYRKSELQEYAKGEARVLVGLRHTGAGNGYFVGRINEVRLYTRALLEAELAASHAAGPLKGVPPASTQAIQDEEVVRSLAAKAAELEAELAKRASATAPDLFQKAAGAAEHPLHLALLAVTKKEGEFAGAAKAQRQRMETKISEAKAFNEGRFELAWDVGKTGGEGWFFNGPGIESVRCGDFRVLGEGPLVVEGLLPSGLTGAALVSKLGGVAASPDFVLSRERVSVRFAAQGGVQLCIQTDNYPLGNNSTFPKAVVQRREPAWSTLDTTYRKGSTAYVELSTPEFQTRRAAPPKEAAASAPEVPFFVLEKVVFHDGKDAPREEYPAHECLLAACKSEKPGEYLRELGECIRGALDAWQLEKLSEGQRLLLNACLETGILSARADASPKVAGLLAAYRKQADGFRAPLIVPGVAEHQGHDAAFLPRGDHRKPGELVPRGFLEVLDARPIAARQSGRLELAERILSPANPLTARVLSNRIWHWTFGRGLVSTVDNFGRMGERPSHPELLDYLAAHLVSEGWSLKKTLEFLLSTEAFQRASTPTPSALEKDPENALLSHVSVRRLEAESIRDAILSISGKLTAARFGPPVQADAPRRSVYVQQRRNSLPPFLATFDAPKPFTTLGRRDVTTVPAQSLTLLNDPVVLQQARAWAETVSKAVPEPAARIDALFRQGLGRAPTAAEAVKAAAFLEQSGAPENLTPLAHAIFNLKEFIYLR